MIEEMLDSRSGAVVDPRAHCQIRAVSEESAADLAERARSLSVEPHDHVMPSIEVAMGASHLRQVLANLVENAIKYMGGAEKRQVDIATWVDGDHVELAVADTGPEIAEEAIPGSSTPTSAPLPSRESWGHKR